MLEDRGLVKLGRLSGEDLALSSWCKSVYRRIDLVADISTYAKRAMRPNNFCTPFHLLCFFKLFFFTLILIYRGFNILESGGWAVKERCALLQLVKPELL